MQVANQNKSPQQTLRIIKFDYNKDAKETGNVCDSSVPRASVRNKIRCHGCTKRGEVKNYVDKLRARRHQLVAIGIAQCLPAGLDDVGIGPAGPPGVVAVTRQHQDLHDGVCPQAGLQDSHLVIDKLDGTKFLEVGTATKKGGTNMGT